MRSVGMVASLLACVSLVYGAAPAKKAKKGKAPAGVSKEEKAQGFVSLFDGKTLGGWEGAVTGYTPENGALVCQQKGGGNLFTAKEYGDFILRLEYRLEPAGNNGVAIRSPDKGNPAYDGMEIQVLDDSDAKYANLEPVQYTGSIYGAVAAKRGSTKPAGQWNAMEIKAQGSRITVTLNGTVITDADTAKLGAFNIHKHDLKGLHNAKGHLGFCGHGARVEFRNIRVKEL